MQWCLEGLVVNYDRYRVANMISMRNSWIHKSLHIDNVLCRV